MAGVGCVKGRVFEEVLPKKETQVLIISFNEESWVEKLWKGKDLKIGDKKVRVRQRV